MTSKSNKPTANGSDQPTRPARTAEDLARYKAIRERFQREKPSLAELVSSGEYNEPLPMGEYLSIRQAVFALKKAREAAGLSLADMAERTGIDKAALSRIETGQHPNPTVSTLCRYAHALGKRWKWVLENEAVSGREATTGDEQMPKQPIAEADPVSSEKGTFMTRIPITLTNAAIRNPHIPVLKEYRKLFPPYRVEFVLETPHGHVTTYMTSAPGSVQPGDDDGKYFSKGMTKVFQRLGKRAGDQVFIEIVEPMKRYRLSC